MRFGISEESHDTKDDKVLSPKGEEEEKEENSSNRRRTSRRS